jgi:hypothetical protein
MSGESGRRDAISLVFVQCEQAVFFLHLQVSKAANRFRRQRGIRGFNQEIVIAQHRFFKSTFKALIRNFDLLVAQFGNGPLLVDGRTGGEN